MSDENMQNIKLYVQCNLNIYISIAKGLEKYITGFFVDALTTEFSF